jgi:hypothetical protein
MNLPDFNSEIRLPEYMSPDDLIILFIIYYPPEIIKYIIEMTNLNTREPRDLDLSVVELRRSKGAGKPYLLSLKN